MRLRPVPQALLALAVAVAGLVTVEVRSPSPSKPLRMNDYVEMGIGQSLWHNSAQMFAVEPVPSFNQPVRIRAVELRTVFHARAFASPSRAYLLRFFDQDYYGGPQLTTAAGIDVYTDPALHRPSRGPLDRLRVQKFDKHLSVVIPLVMNGPGCYEAQVVFRVSTGDGTIHTVTTRWFVSVDTGLDNSEGDDLCAGPRPIPSPSPTVPV